MRKSRKLVAILFAMALTLIGVVPAQAQSAGAEREVVKAGFFAWDGYHMEDGNGVRSGYGFDFLKMAENYNNWAFEFVGYDKTWADMLDMLDTGKIDLVTSAQKTPEWEEKYDYSNASIGTSSTIFTARSDDTRFVAGDMDTYNGMTIGCLEGSSRNKSFADFAGQNNFSYHAVYYANLEELESALYNQEVDGIVGTNLRTMEGEKILEELDPTDYYVIVKKGNQELLDKINKAIAEMDMNSPSWRTNLKDKYFTNNSQKEFVFDKEELEYIEQLKADGTVLTVATNPDLAPYSSFNEEGEAIGIAPRIFEKIANQIGLKYVFQTFDTYEEYNQYIRDGKADIDLTCFSDYGLAAEHGINLTNPYMKTTLAMLTKDTFDGELHSIAELEAVDNNTTYTAELLDSVVSQLYTTHEDCIQAVLDGKVDATYLYTYTAQKAVEEDVKNRLLYSIMPEFEVEMAMGVNEQEDYRLASILNEGIRCLEGDYIQHVIQEEIAGIAEKDTIISMIYDYPELALGGIGAIFLVIFLICIYVIRMVNEKKHTQQAQEVSRFMGYVCETNETVMEVNMENMTCTKNNMVDGVLVTEELPYHAYDIHDTEKLIYPEDIEKLMNDQNIMDFYLGKAKNVNQIYFEARAKDESGQYRWYSYTIRTVPKSRTHPNNYVMFKKDIDAVVRKNEEQRRALEDALEAAKNASSAKGQFLSRMSHEIRTPLNAVIGYMEIARDAKDNPTKMLHCVENSDMAARHLLSIINDVLDISSIESGRMKIADEEFDLKKQITAVSNIFYNQSKAKGANFDVVLQDVTEEWVVGDSLRVNQILMNLLSNAVKFTPKEGNITLTVTQVSADERYVYMTFAVKDSGIGMSEEYMSRLFTPFEQESATTAQKFGGTGLGLSITHNLIKMMGGSIDVQSTQGEGTTFVVSLHFGKSATKHEPERAQHDYSHVRVLIVDDDTVTCEYMKALLKRCKVKSDTVNSGADAIRQLKRRSGTAYRYDMCIIDWNMPQMNGIETANRIRKECVQDIPIIIATAYDVTGIEDQAKEAGVDKVIAKPLFQSTMFDLLVSTYGKYEPEETAEQRLMSIQGLHVLLAEDNPMNLEIALEILRKAGLTVDPVTDGAQAVKKFTGAPEKTYDAILMDVQMPVMDGYQATGEIRHSNHPEASTIPIIALTANAFAEDVNDALASGMNDHIAKPVDYSKLYEVLNKYCTKTDGGEAR